MQCSNTVVADNHLSANWFNDSWRKNSMVDMHTYYENCSTATIYIGTKSNICHTHPIPVFRSGDCIFSGQPPLHLHFYPFVCFMGSIPTDEGREYTRIHVFTGHGNLLLFNAGWWTRYRTSITFQKSTITLLGQCSFTQVPIWLQTGSFWPWRKA